MTPSEMDQGHTKQSVAAGSRKERPSGKNHQWHVLAALALLSTVVLTAAACSSNPSGTLSTTAKSMVQGQTQAQTKTVPNASPGSAASSGPSTSAGPPTTDSATASTTSTITTSVTAHETTTTTLAEGVYSDGIYLVGTDISSGLYRGTVNSEKGHWEISSDANGNRFLAGADPTGPFYVKVKYGQYLRLNGVTIKEASSSAADPLATDNITDGTYRVGYDIEAGWYHGVVNGSLGYWEISSDANGTSLVANDYPMGPFTLKVKDGQYLTLRGVTISQ